jgi:pantetheine-phosphate adenylyltransferase
MTVTAIYPGSFDPPTNGHLDLVKRALKLFPHIIIAVGVNSSKAPLFTVEERVALLRRIFGKHATVRSFSGLLVKFCDGFERPIILRGLREVTDFEFELGLAHTNRALTGVETVFLTTRPENSFVASSAVKEIARLGGDVSEFVPTLVYRALEKKFPPSDSG